MAPGGIWTNFSIPVGLTAADMATHLDLSWFMREAGFELLESSLERFTHLDLAEVSEYRATVVHNNALFTAKKNESRQPDHAGLFAEYFAGHGQELLGKKPKLSRHVRVSVGDLRVFGGNSGAQSRTLRLQAMGNDILNTEIAGEAAAFLERFFEMADGKHGIGDIIGRLASHYGSLVDEKEMVIGFRSLVDTGVIELS